MVAVEAGCDSSFAVTAEGAVWSWGTGEHGSHGHGDTRNRLKPERIEGLPAGVRMRSVAASSHTLALDFTGRVWAWGLNYYGQVGDGTTTDRLRPVRLEGLERVVGVDAGFYHSLAVDTDGNLFSWGDERGDFRAQTRLRRVAALAPQHAVHVARARAHPPRADELILQDALLERQVAHSLHCV